MNRILRLAMMAPEIIERVIKGEMPVALSASTARKAMPKHWSEQMREYFRE